jgi:hypothetical protein
MIYVGLVTSIHAENIGLPEIYELIEGYRVIKRIEKLQEMGYHYITIDSDELRYKINNNALCSCVSYSPKKKGHCKDCRQPEREKWKNCAKLQK